MKKLLKIEVYEFHKQYTDPLIYNVYKKSQQSRLEKKKKKKKTNTYADADADVGSAFCTLNLIGGDVSCPGA